MLLLSLLYTVCNISHSKTGEHWWGSSHEQRSLHQWPCNRILKWRYLPYISICKAYFSGLCKWISQKIWPYMVLTYLHFRILEISHWYNWVKCFSTYGYDMSKKSHEFITHHPENWRHNSLDWFKGKSTGNHGFYNQI